MNATRLARRSTLRAWTVSIALLLATSIAAAAAAQTRSVALHGTITDASGAVVPDATVDLLAAERIVASATTNEDGRYELPAPAHAPLELRVHRDGFAVAVKTVAGLDAATTEDVVLQAGGVSDTVVVTAARGDESRASVTAAVTVRTAGDIAALGSTSLADVLATVPGLHVEANGREGALTSLFSRGGESDYNLVLIDGVRVNESGGAFDVSRLAAGEIERVEVVRGAQSSLYGSDAMGAVVQVITKRAAASDAPHLTGSIEAGSFDTVRGDARVAGGARQRVDYVVGGAARRTAGAFADRLPEEDRFEQVAFDAAAGATLGARATLRTGLRYSDARGRSVGQIDYGLFNTGSSYDTTDAEWHVDLNHTLGARYGGSATGGYFRLDQLSEDTTADPDANVYAVLRGTIGARFPDSPRLVRLVQPAEYAALLASPSALAAGEFLASTPFGIGNFPFSSRTEFRRPAFRYQGDLLWGGAQRLSVGYEWERESNALVAGQELVNHALFVQQQFTARDRWFAAFGGRIDHKSAYDTFFSPKVSAGVFLRPYGTGAVSSVKVFGNAGKGIKSPTFTERFGGSFADPNPGLKVERAVSLDAGVEATFAGQRWRGTATAFTNHYRDQVEFQSTSPFYSPDGRPDFINIAGSNAHGVELEAALQRPIAGLTASGSYSFVGTEVIDTTNTGAQFLPGQPLLRRPAHSGMLRISYVAGRIGVNWDTRVVGERHDAAFLFLSTPSGETTDITVNPSYIVSGLGIDVKAHAGASIFVRADNVTDRAYETALGFPGTPRSVRVGVRFDLGK